MENSVEMVESAVEVGNGNLIKAAAVILGIGAVIGIAFGIKKVVEKRKVINLEAPKRELDPENEIQ